MITPAASSETTTQLLFPPLHTFLCWILMPELIFYLALLSGSLQRFGFCDKRLRTTAGHICKVSLNELRAGIVMKYRVILGVYLGFGAVQ